MLPPPLFSQAHLDVKPDNIIAELGPDKEFVKLLLIDFGCAKNFVNSKTVHASKSAGSPFFEAPEVKQGKDGLTMQEADVYSIGKTLLVAILGYNPQNVKLKRLQNGLLLGKYHRRLETPSWFTWPAS
jgi:serine/threonine protein kinase